MIKLKNIISRLDDQTFKILESEFKNSNATNFLFLFQAYKSGLVSDNEILETLKLTSNSFYVLKSRLYDKIQEKLSHLEKQSSEGINRQYFLVGSIWDEDDQENRFYNEDIWENGYEDRFKDVVNSINSGDVLILKSTYQHAGKGYLRIKGIGIVAFTNRNGKKIGVKWYVQRERIDINDFANFRSTIAQLTQEDVKKIFSAIPQEKFITLGLDFLLSECGIPIMVHLEIADKNESEKIPFHIDCVETVDRLNRGSAAKSLSRLLNNEVFGSDTLTQGFMVHIQGDWGEGKSTFLNLVQNNLQTSKKQWVVIKYNAWRNQHINPPWWSFLNDIFHQSLEQIKTPKKWLFWFKENLRRLRKYETGKKIVTLSFTLLFLTVIVCNRNIVLAFGIDSIYSTNITTEAKGVGLELLAKLFIAAAGIVGLMFSFSKFISSPIFLTSSDSAKSFMEKSNDPMKKVKVHFEELVDNINSNGKELAVFIDDLDRCNDSFVVGLLEGIQTLFKDKKVLFIVAADKHWVSQCFENHYKSHGVPADKPAQRLGYLFIEKAFQLSIRLPKISTIAKEEYWNFILNSSNPTEVGVQSLDEVTREKITRIILNEKDKEQYFNPNYLKRIEKDFNLHSSDIIDVVLEAIDTASIDLRHRLKAHHNLIDANPRSIKRLANEYTMYRNILVSERKHFNRDKLFRWIVLMNKYPQFTDWLEVNVRFGIDTLPEQFQALFLDNDWKMLYNDERNKFGGAILQEDIILFSGTNGI